MGYLLEQCGVTVEPRSKFISTDVLSTQWSSTEKKSASPLDDLTLGRVSTHITETALTICLGMPYALKILKHLKIYEVYKNKHSSKLLHLNAFNQPL